MLQKMAFLCVEVCVEKEQVNSYAPLPSIDFITPAGSGGAKEEPKSAKRGWGRESIIEKKESNSFTTFAREAFRSYKESKMGKTLVFF